MIDKNQRTEAEILFTGGGEMGELMQSYDWARSPLGGVENWSENLKTTIRLMLTASQPMFIGWGDTLIYLYNDAYKALLGDKHPKLLGNSATYVWPNLWQQLQKQVHSVFLHQQGIQTETVSLIEQCHGSFLETYYTISLNPIQDHQGNVSGIWGIQTEQTQRVITERQWRLLNRLAIPTEEIQTPTDACIWGLACLATNPQDFPFAMIYELNEIERYWSLVESYGIESGSGFSPHRMAMDAPMGCSFAAAIASQPPLVIHLADYHAEGYFPNLGPQPPDQAIVIPLAQSEQVSSPRCLVVGLNPFRSLAGNYYRFIGQVAAQISAHIIHAQAQANLKLVKMRQPTNQREQLLGRERLVNLLDQVDDEFMMFDPDWHYVYVNQRAEQIAGYSRQDLLGRSLWEIFPALKDTRFHQELQQAFVEQKIKRFENYYEAWDCWYENRVYPSPDGIALFATNITERKRAELTLTQTTELLQKRNQELDRFAYIVSHDLKAPLRAIANLSQWLEEDLADKLLPENQQQMQLLRQRVYRMESLISGLLAYSRADRTQVAAERIRVEQLLGEIIDSIAPPSGFTIQIQPPMPNLTAKRVLLSQVFANLIGNAIKHHHQSFGNIKISATKQADFYQFTIKDDGPGIRAEFHDKIFGIFQTLKTDNTQENTGIGLSIVKKIIETEGGRIWLESVQDQGTTFHFTWPRYTRSNS